MKTQNLFKIGTMVVFALALNACGGNSSSNTAPANTTATTPLSNPCMTGQTNCENNFYQYNYSNYGLIPYPVNFYTYGGINNYWNYTGNYGQFCNCPNGYRPIYNNNIGIACMPTQTFQTYTNNFGGAFYWGAYANNSQWVNIPQSSNYQQYYPQNGCYTNVARSCFIDNINECGSGSICQPTGAGSRFGICSSGNYGTQGYGGSGYR